MSKSEMGLWNPQSGQMGSGHGTGRVRQGQVYGVPRTESRVKVRKENRKVMDMKQGPWKRTWVKGEQVSEFQYSVAWSVTGIQKCCIIHGECSSRNNLIYA